MEAPKTASVSHSHCFQFLWCSQCGQSSLWTASQWLGKGIMNLLNKLTLTECCLLGFYVLGDWVKFYPEKNILLPFFNCWSEDSSRWRDRGGWVPSSYREGQQGTLRASDYSQRKGVRNGIVSYENVLRFQNCFNSHKLLFRNTSSPFFLALS